MARIAMVVTNACSPDPRVQRHARWMNELGHDVTIHAFDRRQLHLKDEEFEGYKIVRHHIGNYGYGAKLSTIRGLRKFTNVMKKELNSDSYDLVYCNDADTLRIGINGAKKGLKIIFDMHDISHTWIENSKIPFAKIISTRMERKMINNAKKADLILTSSKSLGLGENNGFVEYLENFSLKSTCVLNYEPYPMKKNEDRNENFTIGYIGRIRDIVGFEVLRNWASKLESKPKILLAGDGVNVNQVRNILGDFDVDYRGPFKQSDLPDLISEIDAMWCVYDIKRGNISLGALPVKMFDAAINGVPSITNSGSLMQDYAENYGIGIPFDASLNLDEISTLCDGLEFNLSNIENPEDVFKQKISELGL